MGAEKFVNSLERDFEFAETEGRVSARIEANVGELFVGKRDVLIGHERGGGLNVVRRGRIAIPIGANANAGAVHRPEGERMARIAAEIEFDGAEATDEDVFEYLLDKRAEGIFGIGLLKIEDEGGDALGGVGQIVKRAAMARLNAPLHSGDAVLDGVDGLARDGHFGEAAQVGGGGFGHHPGTHERGCPRSEYGG